MPKAIVYSKHWNDSVEEPRVTVGWSKESEHVQLAVLMPDGVPLDNTSPEANGWFAQLDRAGINRLIKTLRKARDEAYGRDE